jgi:hypothetical protein
MGSNAAQHAAGAGCREREDQPTLAAEAEAEALVEPRAFPAGEDVTDVHAKALSDTCQDQAASDTCPGQEQAAAGLLILILPVYCRFQSGMVMHGI